MRKEGKERGIVQDLFVGAQLGFLALFASWMIPIIQLLIFYDGWVEKKTHFRLEGNCFSFLTQLKDFKDSARALFILELFPLFLLGSLPSLFVHPLTPDWLFLGFPLLYFPEKGEREHLMILWERQLISAILRPFRRKQEGFLPFVKQEVISKQEIFTSKSSQYPLFRYTHGFQGKKEIEIGRSSGEKPHVMFLFIESLRTKDLGALGGTKEVTPYLDALAQESYLFSEFYANSLPTFRSFFTSFFGLPYSLEMKTMLDKNISSYGLPQLMQENGYQTNFFTGADWGIGGIGPFLRQLGADCIYDKKDVDAFNPSAEGASWGIHDEYLFEMTLDHFEKAQNIPQFYSVLTISSHHPWILPSHYSGISLEGVEDRKYRDYLRALHYADQQVGMFIEKLKSKNLTENLILFIMGDHGVSFGDDSWKTFFHVPLMIYAEGRIQNPRVISERGSQCDLLPTVMDFLDIKGHQHSIGRSLLREEKNPRVFLHNSLNVKGTLQCLERGENLKHPPLLETFEAMLVALYDKNLLVPKNYRKIEKGLSIEPYHCPSTLSRKELEETIYQKSPMISMSFSNNHHLDLDLLTKISKWNPELDYFHVNGSYSLTDEALGKVLKRCQHLYDLSISNCFLLSEKCLDFLPKSLMKLNLFGLEFVNDEHFIRPLKYLEKLNIRETPLTAKGLLRFPDLFPTLTYLSLSYHHMTMDVIETILKKLPLYYLSLHEGGSLSESDALELFRKHPTLHSLCFEDCPNLTDDFFEKIGETNISELYLYGTPHLTDRGLQAILKLPLNTLHIDGAPNLTGKAFELLDRYREKFVDISVKVLST